MKSADLLKHGWRRIGRQHNGHGLTVYWDHPRHQPERRGAFTTTDAMNHQKNFMLYGMCDCINTELYSKRCDRCDGWFTPLGYVKHKCQRKEGREHER